MLKDKQYFIRGFSLFFIVYLLSSIFLSGCANLPVEKGALPGNNVNEVGRLPLVSLCKTNGISLDYDAFTRRIILSKDFHKVDLMLGERLAIVDGRSLDMKYPLSIYQGAIVASYKFKEDIIDSIFGIIPKDSSQQTCLVNSVIKRIVVDAGHGGYDPGAIGVTGLREKNVNLDIAKRLAKLLKDSGFEVVMTRSSDSFISLERRVKITNSASADLFISIHSNANRVKSLRGFEVYYVSPYADDTLRAMNAAKSARLDLDGADFGSDSVDLKAIVWNMIYGACRAESLGLAQDVCRLAKNSLDVDVLGIKGANYYVLKGARIPAILIETGFLTNPGEEKKLKNSYYRQQVAEAINDGVRGYTQRIALAKGGIK